MSESVALGVELTGEVRMIALQLSGYGLFEGGCPDAGVGTRHDVTAVPCESEAR